MRVGDGALRDQVLGAWSRVDCQEISWLEILAKALDRVNAKSLWRIARLTPAEGRVINQLSIEASATIGQLSAWSWVDRAEVSRAVASLVKRGWLRREESPVDRRSPRFSFTEEGRSVANKVLTWQSELEKALQTKLDDSHREALDIFLPAGAEACARELGVPESRLRRHRMMQST